VVLGTAYSIHDEIVSKERYAETRSSLRLVFFSPSVIESITTRKVSQCDVISMEELKGKNRKYAAWKTNKSREL
jgi:hypothetical protein